MMEKIIEDIKELKLQYEEELEALIIEFCNSEFEETHANVILFKKKVNWCKIYIVELDNIIYNNTK
jgi:phosphopantothenate synthetase